MTTLRRWGIWGALVCLLIVALVYSNRSVPIQVQVATVERGDVERSVANTRVGTVKACERSRLSPAIGGQVARLYVAEGQAVKQGELLLELWNEDRKAMVQRAVAYGEFAERDRQRICITADSDYREAERINRLLERKLSSEEEADQAQSRSDASRAACSSAEAKVDEAKAAVAVANAALEQTFLKAPFAGIVAEVTGEVGEFTTPSPPGVATPPAIDLLTSDCHYVSAPIDEVDAAAVQVGMRVRITLDAFKGQKFDGVVRRIAAYVQDYEKQARTVDVEADFSASVMQGSAENQSSSTSPISPAHQLIAGYSADIEVVLDTKSGVLKVPTEAIINDDHVLLLNGDNVIEKRSVMVGLSNWRFSEVSEGLAEGERVIIALGRNDLAPGMAAEGYDVEGHESE